MEEESGGREWRGRVVKWGGRRELFRLDGANSHMYT